MLTLTTPAGLVVERRAHHQGAFGIKQTDRAVLPKVHAFEQVGEMVERQRAADDARERAVRALALQGNSRSMGATARASDNLDEPHRLEIPNVDANIELARQRLQLAVAMAM
jgi:hypothetical protein